MTLKVTRIVLEFLQAHPEEQFTAREIADWIFRTYPAECREKQEHGKAKSDTALVQQIAAQIAAQRSQMEKKSPQLKTTEGRPRKYYCSTITDEAKAALSENAGEPVDGTAPGYTERDLYPLLKKFLKTEFNLHSKRIDETRAKKRGPGGNRWLFPDLVGLEDLSAEWHTEIKGCVKEIADRKTKLWSFEVKKFINRANVREVYFQTVSNSSWANFGYLVAAEIQGAEKELRMLAGLHGIGLIRLDVESPEDSEILIPARERIDVDWNTANRLAKENPDFLDYIKFVRQFYQTGEVRTADWSIPPD